MLDADFVARRGDMTVQVGIAVGKGETLALVGPNGAGKSTILHALCGLVPIASGRIALGEVVWCDTERGVFLAPHDRHIGVVFQDLRLFPHLTVRDNVSFGVLARGLPMSRVDEAMEFLGIVGMAPRRPAELSGGERQLVALARAIATDPPLLVLDEPTAALDADVRPRVRAALRELLNDGSRVNVIVTHEPVDALSLADRVAVVEDGITGAAGTVSETARHPGSRYAATFVGLNLLRGTARTVNDHIEVETEAGVLFVALPEDGMDPSALTRVDLVIHPTAITLSTEPLHTSARNNLQMMVCAVQSLGGRVRVDLGPLIAEITQSAAEELNLKPGADVYASIKATQITFLPHEYPLSGGQI